MVFILGTVPSLSLALPQPGKHPISNMILRGDMKYPLDYPDFHYIFLLLDQCFKYVKTIKR